MVLITLTYTAFGVCHLDPLSLWMFQGPDGYESHLSLSASQADNELLVRQVLNLVHLLALANPTDF